MAPLARWIFAAVAAFVLWIGLSGGVPVGLTFFGPDGEIVSREWRRCGQVAAWGDPMSPDVRETIAELRTSWGSRLENTSAVAYKRWDAWVCQMGFMWVCLCGLLWPILWLFRHRAGWLPASRFSLACMGIGFMGMLLLGATGGPEGIHTTLVVPFIAVFMGRAAAAPEGGAPWFSMVPGRRMLGATLLTIAVSLVCLLSSGGGSDLGGLVIACLVTAAIGVAPSLCLAPKGQSRAWARHFMVLGAVWIVALLLTVFLQQVTVALSPKGAYTPDDFVENVLGLLGGAVAWVTIVMLAERIAGLFRRFLAKDAT